MEADKVVFTIIAVLLFLYAYQPMRESDTFYPGHRNWINKEYIDMRYRGGEWWYLDSKTKKWEEFIIYEAEFEDVPYESVR